MMALLALLDTIWRASACVVDENVVMVQQQGSANSNITLQSLHFPTNLPSDTKHIHMTHCPADKLRHNPQPQQHLLNHIWLQRQTPN